MKIATWNINSVKVRLPQIAGWLAAAKPDILLLQELKGLEFPAMDFKALGYESAAVPQKAYNGVAILSRAPVAVRLTALPGDPADEQARYLEADIGGLRVINIYAPNGNPVDSEKFPYKLAWLERLKHRLRDLRRDEVPFVVGGDFNIIPEPRDCHDPKLWAGDALFRMESRRAWRAMLNLGLTDALRVHNQKAAQYTFWDYQAGAWPQNKGIRIDHFLLAPSVADRLAGCAVDPAPRGGDNPSDHTPVVMELRAAA